MSDLTLRISAIDGGAALTLFDGRGAIEIRMGHRGVYWLVNDLDRAASLDPPRRPVIDGVVGAEWIDQMLEIREQPIGISKGLGCEPSRETFLRVIGALPDFDAVLDAPAAVFAFNAEPEGRMENWSAGYRMTELEETEFAAASVELAPKLARGGKNCPKGGATQFSLPSGAVIWNFDENARRVPGPECAKVDVRHAWIATATGRLPLNLTYRAAQPGQHQLDHPDLSCVWKRGVEAESPEGSPAPSATTLPGDIGGGA